MKKVILFGMLAFSMLLVSCGGDSAEGTTTDTTAVVEAPKTVVTQYTIDTTATIINWKAYGKIGDTSKYHAGTIKALSGTVSASDSAGVTALVSGDLAINMNSAKESAGATDLDGHLLSPDFFDVNKFASSNFTFEKFENGTITGSLSLIGHTVAITAPAEVTITADNVTVNVSMFKIDCLAIGMPYFVGETKLKPAKQHDPNIEITATVVAVKAL